MIKDLPISRIKARQIFDSRGRPTVETEVLLGDGHRGRASVPSGASTGTFEAFELRDGDPDLFDGLSVYRAVENVNTEIAENLKCRNAFDQREIDAFLVGLDGTPNLKRLGANAVLGVSLALCRASARSLEIPLYQRIAELSGTARIALPVPMVNILSGGKHAGGGMDVQDFLFIPARARSAEEAIRRTARVRSAADRLARDRGLSTLLADEGGLSPGFARGRKALEFMVEAFEMAGLEPGKDAFIAIDVAAATLETGEGNYFFPRENRSFSSAEMIRMIEDWTRNFPVISVEDALGEEDWTHWKILTERLGQKVRIVGDDLLTTSLPRLEKAIGEKAANSILIKLNQNGTLTGTLDVIRRAQESGFATIVSARSGETGDDFIADLAAGTAAGQIKIGSLRNSERLNKYNRLLEIEEETGASLADFG